MENLNKIILNENGQDKEYSVLSTFNIKGIENPYVAYTDYSIDQNNKVDIKVSKYNLKEEKIELIPIVDEKEKKAIDEYLIELKEHIESHRKH